MKETEEFYRKKYPKVKELSAMDIEIISILDDFKIKKIEPIELTSDLMWDLGFKCLGKSRDWFDFIKEDDRFAISINIKTGKFALYLNGDWITVNCPNKFKYIHQVQNLMADFGYTVVLSE